MAETPGIDLADLRRRIRAADKAGHVGTQALLCREYLRVAPYHGPTWLDLGMALVPMARYREAIGAFRKALGYSDGKYHRFIYAHLGHLYKRWGRYLAAAKWYQKFIDADPADATGHIFRGGALARHGRLREAEAAHRTATGCQKGCIDEAYLNLGLVLRAQGRSGEAAECFRKALEITPTYGEARTELADVEQILAELEPR